MNPSRIARVPDIHPAADIFPMMSDADYALLRDDIREHGLRQPLLFIGSSRESAQLLDGRNRLRAITELCLDADDHADVIHPDDIPDPVAYVLSLNLNRRHLTDSQRAMVANKVATLKRGDNQHTAIAVSSSQAEAASKLNVSVDSVQRARKVTDHAVPAIVAAVERGEVTVSAAAAVANLPDAEQEQLIEAGPKAVQQAAAATRKPIQSKEWVQGQSSIPDVQEHAPEDSESDTLFHLKRYWKQAKKKDRQAFLEWTSEQDRKPGDGALGVGIEKAHEAIAYLKRIPAKDALRQRAFEVVSDWIEHNGPAVKVKSGKSPLAELRTLFDATGNPWASDRFVNWTLSQTDYETIKNGCAAWLAWGNELMDAVHEPSIVEGDE